LQVFTCNVHFLSWLLNLPNYIDYKQAYAQLLEEEDIKIPAWFSFNSKDGVNVVSGDSLMECGSIAESCNKVVAVGINCTPPRFIHGLIVLLKKVKLRFSCFQYVVCRLTIELIFLHIINSYFVFINLSYSFRSLLVLLFQF